MTRSLYGVAVPLFVPALWRDHCQTPWVINGCAVVPGRAHRGFPNPRHIASVLNQLTQLLCFGAAQSTRPWS